MSALPPKADMYGALAYVCFGPKAGIDGSELDECRSRPSECRAPSKN
jgi:hypothetical protein